MQLGHPKHARIRGELACTIPFLPLPALRWFWLICVGKVRSGSLAGFVFPKC